MEPLAIVVIVALLALNALFVAAEFAIVGAPRTVIAQLATAGSQRAASVARIQREPRLQDRYIATAQLGITMASLGLGMYGEEKLAAWIASRLALEGAPAWVASHALAGGVALIVLTYLHIVLGEMVPKAVALARAERAVLWLTPLMLGLQIATYPLVAALNGTGNAFLRLLGVDRRFGGGQPHTPEELRYLVREAEEGGLVRSEAADVIDELLEFGDLTAREVMVPRVRIRGVEMGVSLGGLGQIVMQAPHARYPVYAHDLDHIVGMIHIREIARCVREGTSIRQTDIRPIPFIPGSATLDTVLVAMREANTQMVVVMDEHGGTDGLLTTEELFEEVIGDIQDPASDAPPELYVASDGTQRAAGTVRLDELGELLERELEHEEVDTVSGLVLALLDRPPRIGDCVQYDGVELEVLQVTGLGVGECRVTVVPSGEAAHDTDRDRLELHLGARHASSPPLLTERKTSNGS
jgi:CBS domain containing-hemolysin-like protein